MSIMFFFCRPASEIVGDSLRLISGNEQEASRLQNVWVSDTSSSCNCPCFLRVKALEEQIKSHHSSFGELFNRLGQAENSLTWAWNYINNMVSYFCIICIIIFKYLSQLKQRQMKKNTLGGWQLKNREKQKR